MDSSTSSDEPFDLSSASTEEEEIDNIRLQLIRQTTTLLFPPQVRRSRRANKNRDRTEANNRLLRGYFSDNPTYDAENFKRRFRMTKQLFERIVHDLKHTYEFFQDGYDAQGYKSFTPLQKCTSAIRQLAYSTAADAFDEYLQMAESTSRVCLLKFCEGINALYGKQYLRKHTYSNIQLLYNAHSDRHGFPGMLGSLDCTHWDWTNCPIAWRGQYMRGDHNRPTLLLQVVASQDLWIWDAYFGAAGSINDINVLHMSNLFEDVCQGIATEIPFEVNGVAYAHGYYLVDGIYPEWATFVKDFSTPNDDRRIRFKTFQEAARKDMERCFGVLKRKWHIVQIPCRMWYPNKIRKVMYARIILHNMIIENEGRKICNNFDPNDYFQTDLNFEVDEQMYNAKRKEVQRSNTHHALRHDLTEHISQIPHGHNNDA